MTQPGEPRDVLVGLASKAGLAHQLRHKASLLGRACRRARWTSTGGRKRWGGLTLEVHRGAGQAEPRADPSSPLIIAGRGGRAGLVRKREQEEEEEHGRL